MQGIAVICSGGVSWGLPGDPGIPGRPQIVALASIRVARRGIWARPVPDRASSCCLAMPMGVLGRSRPESRAIAKGGREEIAGAFRKRMIYQWFDLQHVTVRSLCVWRSTGPQVNMPTCLPARWVACCHACLVSRHACGSALCSVLVQLCCGFGRAILLGCLCALRFS